MASFLPLRRSTRIAAISTTKIVESGKSDQDIVRALIQKGESTILAERAVAILNIMEFLLTHQTIWKTHMRFQQVTLNKAIEFRTAPHNETIALVSAKIRQVSEKLEQAILDYRKGW